MSSDRRRQPRRGINVRLTGAVEAVRSGLWFVPSLCVVAAIGLSLATAALDRQHGGDEPTWLVLSRDPDVAMVMLSTIAGSTLTFTGALFSITVVALQLASSQFSPRVLRGFLRDRTNQWCLGVFLATFVFALLGLRAVHPGAPEGDGQVPGLTLTTSFALVLASLAAFVLFVHHVTQSIRVVSIIDNVAAECRGTISDVLPADPDPAGALIVPTGEPARRIAFERGPGVIVAIDHHQLVQLACDHDAVVVLRHRPGDHLASGVAVADLYGEGSAKVDEERVLELIGTGPERTAHQDVGAGLRQLADIAVKALSPGVNDPTTAIQSLDRIHDLLRRIGTGHLPSGRYADDSGRLRLVVPDVTWAGYVSLSFDEIRRYGSDSLQVLRRLRAVVEELLASTAPDRHQPLVEQLHRLDRTVAEEPDPADGALAAVPDDQGLGAPSAPTR